MKSKLFIMLVIAPFLALASTAVASTTWYVNGVSGSDGNSCRSATLSCKTIEHAISLASSGDTIMVAPAIYKENLTIYFSLNIVGSGATTTIIDGGGVSTVVIVSNNAATHVTLSKVTVQNGFAHGGGGIANFAGLTIIKSTIRANTGPIACFRFGKQRFCVPGISGISNLGNLTVIDTTISGNIAMGLGGSSINTYPSSASASISNSTISGNTGGGVGNGGSTTISNSTISGNTGNAGIFNGGKLRISNSTIYGNIFNGLETTLGTVEVSNSTLDGNGIGILNASSVTQPSTVILQNSIVANNVRGNCGGVMTPTSLGYNLSSDNTCNFNSAGDLNNTDPTLGPLQNNGGPTQTMALLPGSPAIDAGNPSGCTDNQGHLLKTDQRRMPRPDSEDAGGCDIGAYEKQSD